MVDLFHLERVTSRLNSPDCYGIRLDFLDMEMTKEEQLAFIAARDFMLTEMHELIKALVSASGKAGKVNETDVPHVVPRDLGSFAYTTSSLFGSRPQECSACKGVFMVDPAWMSTSISGHIRIGGMRTVTCPYCGRTERYTGI